MGDGDRGGRGVGETTAATGGPHLSLWGGGDGCHSLAHKPVANSVSYQPGSYRLQQGHRYTTWWEKVRRERTAHT